MAYSLLLREIIFSTLTGHNVLSNRASSFTSGENYWWESVFELQLLDWWPFALLTGLYDLTSRSEWVNIGCLKSQSTIFHLYLWRHIDVQAKKKSDLRWDSHAIDFSYGSLMCPSQYPQGTTLFTVIPRNCLISVAFYNTHEDKEDLFSIQRCRTEKGIWRISIPCWHAISIARETGRDLTQSCDKKPYTQYSFESFQHSFKRSGFVIICIRPRFCNNFDSVSNVTWYKETRAERALSRFSKKTWL